jgi:hypothetical protein
MKAQTVSPKVFSKHPITLFSVGFLQKEHHSQQTLGRIAFNRMPFWKFISK